MSDLETKLAALVDAYQAARARTAAAANPSPAPGRCPYCGGAWARLWRSSYDGHARCVVDREFRVELLRLAEGDSRMTVTVMSQALGVYGRVLAAWYDDALAERDGKAVCGGMRR